MMLVAKIAGGVIGILLVVLIAFGVTAGEAWILGKVLDAVGHPLAFWPRFGIITLAHLVLGGGAAARSKTNG